MRYKTGVSFDNVYYNIDGENRVVVCNIACDLNITRREDKVSIYTYDLFAKKFPFIKNERFVAKGVARCNPQDTFDETIGKRIAESRAKKQAYSIATRVFNYCAEILKGKMADFKFLAENNSIVANREKDHIRELADQII